MPLTLLEALSYGKKVLVSNIIENLQVTEDVDNCYSFDKSDINDLHEKLKTILKDSRDYNPEEVIKIIEEQYSWEKVV